MTRRAGQLIEVKMPKCTLFFTQQELQHLLSRDPELWAIAIRRGKHILRERKEKAREGKQMTRGP